MDLRWNQETNRKPKLKLERERERDKERGGYLINQDEKGSEKMWVWDCLRWELLRLEGEREKEIESENEKERVSLVGLDPDIYATYKERIKLKMCQWASHHVV